MWKNIRYDDDDELENELPQGVGKERREKGGKEGKKERDASQLCLM